MAKYRPTQIRAGISIMTGRKSHKRQKQQKKKQSNHKLTSLLLVKTQKQPAVANNTSTGNIKQLLHTATRVGTLTSVTTAAIQVNAMTPDLVIKKVFSLVDPLGRSYLVNCFASCPSFAEEMFRKGFDVLQRNTTLSNVTRLVANVTCGWPRVSVLQEGNETFTQYGTDLLDFLSSKETNCETSERVTEDFFIGDMVFNGIIFLVALGLIIKYFCFEDTSENRGEYQSVPTRETDESPSHGSSASSAASFQNSDRADHNQSAAGQAAASLGSLSGPAIELEPFENHGLDDYKSPSP